MGLKLITSLFKESSIELKSDLIRIVQSYGIEKTNRERMRELEKTICTNYFDYLQIVMPGLKNFRTRQGKKMTREQVNQRFLTPRRSRPQTGIQVRPSQALPRPHYRPGCFHTLHATDLS